MIGIILFLILSSLYFIHSDPDEEVRILKDSSVTLDIEVKGMFCEYKSKSADELKINSHEWEELTAYVGNKVTCEAIMDELKVGDTAKVKIVPKSNIIMELLVNGRYLMYMEDYLNERHVQSKYGFIVPLCMAFIILLQLRIELKKQSKNN